MNDMLAKRYAKALLLVGIDQGRQREFGAELADFSRAMTDAGEEGRALVSPIHPRDVRGRALEAVLAKADLSETVANFVRLLHDRGRLGKLSAMAAAYSDLLDASEGLVRGTLTSAAHLSDGETAAVRSALSTFIGRKVELTVVEDPSIIGGLVARLGDLVVDASLRTRLDGLGRRFSA